MSIIPYPDWSKKGTGQKQDRNMKGEGQEGNRQRKEGTGGEEDCRIVFEVVDVISQHE